MSILDICEVNISDFSDSIIKAELDNVFEDDSEYKLYDGELEVNSNVLITQLHFSSNGFWGKDKPKIILSGQYFKRIKYANSITFMDGSYNMDNMMENPIIIDKVDELTFGGSGMGLSNKIEVGEVNTLIYYPNNHLRENIIPYINSHVSNINTFIISDYIDNRSNIDFHKIVGVTADEMLITKSIIRRTPDFDEILDFIIKNNNIKQIYVSNEFHQTWKLRCLFEAI